MKERPILFSGPMVRAILEGRKSQTRRALKPQPPTGDWDVGNLTAELIYPTTVDRYGEEQPGEECFGATCESGEWCLPCPYGQPGDLLWVRETWGVADAWLHDSVTDPPRCIAYRADHAARNFDPVYDADTTGWGWERMRWRPPIFMPRWASRLTLRITKVRVERLQEIREDDAVAEGWPGPDDSNSIASAYPIAWYSALWEQINGKGSWDANPWVWVISFERIEQQERAA